MGRQTNGSTYSNPGLAAGHGDLLGYCQEEKGDPHVRMEIGGSCVGAIGHSPGTSGEA